MRSWKFLLIFMMVIWISIPTQIISNIQENDQKSKDQLFQLGTIPINIFDEPTTHCYTQQLNLSENQTQYTQTVSFHKIEQNWGVRFGLKSFSVDSHYLPEIHSLSILVSIYGKYEWKALTIAYLVSATPQLYLSTYTFDIWNFRTCKTDIEQQQGQLAINIPKQYYSNALIFIKGVVCPAEKCAFTIVNYQLSDDHLIIVNYEYSVELGLVGKTYPVTINLGFGLFTEQWDYYAWVDEEADHIKQTAGSDRDFNNQIDPDYIISQMEQYNDKPNTLNVLSSVEKVLNYYSLMMIQQRKYAIMTRQQQQVQQYVSEHECYNNYNGTLVGQSSSIYCQF